MIYDLDIKLILEFKNSFEKYHPVCILYIQQMQIHIQKIHNQNPGFIVINNCLTWQLETENGFSKVQSVQVQKLSPISQVVRLLNNKIVLGQLREESRVIIKKG